MRLFTSPRKERKPAHRHNPPPESYSMPACFGPSSPIWNAAKKMPSALAPQAPMPSPHPDIVLHQHYHVAYAPSHSYSPSEGGGPWHEKVFGEASTGCEQPNSCPAVRLATDILPVDEPLSWRSPVSTLLNQGGAVSSQVASELGDVLTLIDRDELNGPVADFLLSSQPLSQSLAILAATVDTPRRMGMNREPPPRQTAEVAASSVAGSYFAKADLYANSKLPPDLPAMRLYIPTYPLLSLAARYAANVYQKPRGAERSHHIDADYHAGTKAMVIKSVPMDSSNTIVFAIRGTAHFADWAVNLKVAPTSPVGLLDDLENLCHSGFLSTARKMIAPVAKRLRQLLEEDLGRASYTLLITGHSAGGAVATLLYLHMLSVSNQAASELNLMTSSFRRVHCITFGTPPIALLPLTKPNRRGLESSLFLSFINEGDPVARADKAYVKSLVRLFASPLPALGRPASGTESEGRPIPPQLHKVRESSERPVPHISRHESSSRHDGARNSESSYAHGHNQADGAIGFLKPTWDVPPATCSNAGRLIVLRSGDANAPLASKKTVEERLDEGVVAQFTTDEQLRGIVWGDPISHAMKLYAGRIETLAIGAIMVETCA